jgi:hypothetical protein
MVSSASKGARVAAGIVCAVFVPFVLIHLLWATGNTWGLKAVSGDQLGGGVEHASTGLTVVSLFRGGGRRCGDHRHDQSRRLAQDAALGSPASPRQLGACSRGRRSGRWTLLALGDSGRSRCRWRSPRSSSHGRTQGRTRENRDGLRSCAPTVTHTKP